MASYANIYIEFVNNLQTGDVIAFSWGDGSDDIYMVAGSDFTIGSNIDETANYFFNDLEAKYSNPPYDIQYNVTNAYGDLSFTEYIYDDIDNVSGLSDPNDMNFEITQEESPVSIFVGNTQINNVYIGNTKIKRIYIGDVLI